jgi:hypothetical protein
MENTAWHNKESYPAEHKERLEHPVDFSESMIGNLAASQFQQARNFNQNLIEIVKAHDAGRLTTWTKSINFDPESLGSAFYMVYQFAEDYLQKLSKAKG